MGVPPKGTPKYKRWLAQQKNRKRQVRLEAAKAKARKLLKNEIGQLRSEVDAVTRRSNKHFRNAGAYEAALAAARREKRSLIKKLAAAKGVHDMALELMNKARKEQQRANDRLQWWEGWWASLSPGVQRRVLVVSRPPPSSTRSRAPTRTRSSFGPGCERRQGDGKGNGEEEGETQGTQGPRGVGNPRAV